MSNSHLFAVIARLDRAIQYSRDASVQPRRLWNTGFPAFAEHDRGKTRLRILAAHRARVMRLSRRISRDAKAEHCVPRKSRRAQGKPDAGRTREACVLKREGCTQDRQAKPMRTGLPCAMVYGL